MATFWNIRSTPCQSDIYSFDNLDKAFDAYTGYEEHLFIGDFNTETSEPRIDCFFGKHELHKLAKEKICFKSVHNPSCIHLILTNNVMAFQNTKKIFTS